LSAAHATALDRRTGAYVSEDDRDHWRDLAVVAAALAGLARVELAGYAPLRGSDPEAAAACLRLLSAVRVEGERGDAAGPLLAVARGAARALGAGDGCDEGEG
jgi:hypothetical protein